MSVLRVLICAAALAAGGHAAVAQTVFSASGAAAVLDCHGGVARVQGSGNRLSIGGACSRLVIEGAGNQVAIDLAPGAPVRIAGSGNRVLYHAPVAAPPAETSGRDNVLVPDPRPPTVARAALPTLLIADVDSAYDLDCAGRDVLVRGDGLRFVLRGGCRSVSVEGRLDSITAELLPGAAVSVGGPGVILNYVLVAQGPAPVVRTTAPGLRATQIQHYGDSQLTLPTGR